MKKIYKFILILLVMSFIFIIFIYPSIRNKKRYKIEKISNAKYHAMLKKRYVYSDKKSPDKKVIFDIEDYGSISYDISFQKVNGDKIKIEDRHYSGIEKIYWAPDSKRVAFIDRDFFSYGPDHSLVIIGIERLEETRIDFKDLIKGQNAGQREMIQASDPCWLTNEKLIFSLKLNYLGYSGHPGINANRKQKLGENFARDDPVDAGSFLVDLIPGD